MFDPAPAKLLIVVIIVFVIPGGAWLLIRSAVRSGVESANRRHARGDDESRGKK